MDIERKNASPYDVDISALRSASGAGQGPRYWRGLEELADTPEFRNHLENEFPHGPNDPDTKFDRRDLLKVMAASAAFAGLCGCTKLPTQKIVPYVRQPEEIVPGRPLFYATATTLGGVATGILVESHMGRPTKIEGNPDHPGSLGAADAFSRLRSSGCTTPIARRRKFTMAGSEAGRRFRMNSRRRWGRRREPAGPACGCSQAQ